MEQLFEKCRSEQRSGNSPGIIDAAKEIITAAVKEAIEQTVVERDYVEVMKALMFVINTNSGNRYRNTSYAEAYALLGKVFETGIFKEHSLKKAYICYKIAAENSNPFGCYRLAYFYEHGLAGKKHKHKAAHFYKLSANGGSTRGIHKYGMLLLEGTGGCARDIKGAVFYLEQARKLASSDYPDALFDLGQCYEGLPLLHGSILEDHAYALKLYLEGAELGCPRSTVRVGHAYHYGELGVEQNLELATNYYVQAEATSASALFELYKIGKASKQDNALNWLYKSAQMGHPDGIKIYANKLELGDGVPMNKLEALWWYKIGEKRGADTKQGIRRCKQ
ncbi:hypothetical protein NEDG_01663 [Nematocida displodere]|uniref:SEL1 protein n=1 Tax=Nematocida displodere TaxID=1805483 RepID=A0A177EIM4_9MICR|nr:hypothetical protein NEDG_01663 [Nematocida displodere]